MQARDFLRCEDLGEAFDLKKRPLHIFFFSDLDDECRDMMCGGSCQYNYGYNEFACTCPENTYLNDDGSSCVLFDSAGKFDFSSLLLTWYVRFRFRKEIHELYKDVVLYPILDLGYYYS